MSRNSITKQELWAEAVCQNCNEVIRRGDPRCVVFFAELGIGPGHPAYTKENVEFDRESGSRECGPDWRFSTALAFHVPCAGNNPQIELPDYWYWWREQRAVDDPGRSVRAIPLSYLRIASGDLQEDYRFMGKDEKDDNGLPTPARTEAEDRLLSSDPQPAKKTEADVWHDMPRFLDSPAGRKLPVNMRAVAKLRSEDKVQVEIARELGVDQGTVSRNIARVRSAYYAWTSGF